MDPRYETKSMKPVWTYRTKFATWERVELAAIEARFRLGRLEEAAFRRIKQAARFTLRGIKEREAKSAHDLQAFVDEERAHLEPQDRHQFHKRMTSYDTEVPALALQFGRAGAILLANCDRLIAVLRTLASKHVWTFCMGNTHGQDAKPTTFGWRVCSYLEMAERSRARLEAALEEITYVKFSGAVGNNMTIDPELEAAVCKLLGLKVRRAATQIVGRDVFSNLLSVMAITGGVIEKIAVDMCLLATSAFGETKEPKRSGMKGSSAMPHKWNTDVFERMRGMSIILRGYAAMGLEIISTWLERDIAQSCVERVAFADASHILNYMLERMCWLMENLIVNREAMWLGINRSRGCWAAEEVKDILGERGAEPELVYGFTQSCAFAAFEQGRTYLDVLLTTNLPGTEQMITSLVSQAELEACFQFREVLERNLPVKYQGMGLDMSLALPPNAN